MITNQDIEIAEGDTRSLSIALKKPDGSPYTVPAGGIVYWWASRSMHDQAGEVLIKKISPTSITLAGVGGGTTMTIGLSPGDTLELGWKNLYHEAYVLQLDGVRVHLFSGTMKVSKSLVWA